MYGNRLTALRRCRSYASYTRCTPWILHPWAMLNASAKRPVLQQQVPDLFPHRPSSFCSVAIPGAESFHVEPSADSDASDSLPANIASLIREKAWDPAAEHGLQQFVPLSPEILQKVLREGIEPNDAALFFSWAVAHGGCEAHPDTVKQVACTWAEKYGVHQLSSLAQLLHGGMHQFAEAVWAALMIAFNMLKQPSDAIALFRKLVKSGLAPTALSCDALLFALVKDDRCDDALRIIRELISAKHFPDLKALGVFLDHLCKNGKSMAASDLIKNIGNFSDKCYFESAYSRFITAASKVMRPGDAVLDLLNDMKERGLNPDKHAYNACIKILCRTHKLDAAQNMLVDMRERKCVPENLTYMALIHGYYYSGKPQEALSVIELMLSQGCSMDTKVYEAKMQCLFAVNRANEACETFELMLIEGFSPELSTYSILVQNLCDIGEVDLAKKIMVAMVKEGIQPNAGVYLSLAQGLINRWRFEELVQLVSEIRAKGFQLNAEVYRSLVTYYLTKGDTDAASSWFKEMTTNGLKPTSYITAKMASSFNDSVTRLVST